jgi:hypothetical protein
MPIKKYDLVWKDGADAAQIEREMIKNGGRWESDGKTYGNGLLFHFREYWKLLWPQDDQTWWTDLIIQTVLDNQFTSVVGGASAWKSGTIGRLALMDWSCYPDCTTIIISSTNMEGLKARIFAEITMLHKIASEKYEWFPGHPVDYKCAIFADDVDEVDSRDARNSIIGVPCKTSSGKFVGMGSYAGRKNRRVWCIGDEFQFMELSILDGQRNLVSNGSNLVPGIIRDKTHKEFKMPRRGYKAVFISNPNPSRAGNPTDIISEPENGWASIPEDGKTKVWKCKQMPDHPVKCVCVCLDSMDSPNNEYPIDAPRWDNLAGKHKLRVYAEGSESYWSQGRGVFKFGLTQFKIITQEICNQFKAFEKTFWRGAVPNIKIGMMDSAYGAGDRCALGWLEFGECHDGKIRIQIGEMWIVPVIIRADMTPEKQIAIYAKEKMISNGVPPENFFFDGRGSMAMALAAEWSSAVNALEFGGTPGERPAGPDIYVIDSDKGGLRRLKTEREHYSKKVSALWWAWRYVIESDQMRGLTQDIVSDAAPREWSKVKGDKIEIETKEKMKKRTGVSPDLADMMVTGIEGARQRGFTISRLAGESKEKEDTEDFFDTEVKQWDDAIKSGLLKRN